VSEHFHLSDTGKQLAGRHAPGAGPIALGRRPSQRAVVARRWALACAVLALLAAAPGPPPAVAQGSGNTTWLVPLFDRQTQREPATVEDRPEALITRVADRVRDRHAREGNFHAYDHYLPLYWEFRTVAIEIVDRVAKGGSSITYNMTSLSPLNQPNRRTIFPCSQEIRSIRWRSRCWLTRPGTRRPGGPGAADASAPAKCARHD
jgi:hypothetical protein